jgi:hypothetical protein
MRSIMRQFIRGRYDRRFMPLSSAAIPSKPRSACAHPNIHPGNFRVLAVRLLQHDVRPACEDTRYKIRLLTHGAAGAARRYACSGNTLG